MSNSEKYSGLPVKWFSSVLIILLLGFLKIIIEKIINPSSIFTIYYSLFASNIIFIIGGLIWFVGVFIICIKVSISKKIYKSAWICFGIVTIIIGLICRSSFNEGFMYKNIIAFFQDLSYVKENRYCEDMDEFKGIYKSESVGRYKQVSFWVETKNKKYDVLSNIVDKDNYDLLKKELNKNKTVKIKYLPNTQIVLAIEPAKKSDEEN